MQRDIDLLDLGLGAFAAWAVLTLFFHAGQTVDAASYYSGILA